MRTPTVSSRRRALAVSALAVFTALACGALITAAIVAHAPLVVLPLVAGACIGLPMFAAWQLATVHVDVGGLGWALRRRRTDEQAVRELRRSLERLPETAHPLED